MSFSLPPSLAERLSTLAQHRGQSAEHLLADLLAQAEGSYTDFFEHSVEMLCIASADGRLLRLNRAFCAAMGYTEAELLAAPVFALVHPDDAARTWEALGMLYQGQPVAQFANRCRCADGSYKWLSWTSAPLSDGRIYGIARDITHQKQIEDTLKAQISAAHIILENSGDACFTLDRQWRFMYVTAETERLLRTSADALLGVNVWDKFPAAVGSEFYQRCHQVVAAGTPAQFNAYFVPAETWFEIYAYPADNGVAICLRDASQRRRAGQALYESEAFFRAIVESQIDMVCCYHPDTTLVYANDAYCRFFGQHRDKLLGMSYLPLTPPEVHDAVRARIVEVLGDPRPAVREFPAVAFDGTVRYIQWVDQGIVNQHGEVALIQAVGRDITRLKEAEAALKHKEEQYRMLFENNPIPMWVYDPATLRFLAVNEAAVTQYGYSRDEFFRLRVTDLSVPEDRTRLARIISQLKPGRSVPVEWRQMRKDGTIIDMEVFGHDAVFEERPARIALARNVTQRRQLEEQRLYTQTPELELAKQRELAELRERFMSMVSHEFRTPLAIISSSVDIIQHYFDRISREKVDERLADISYQVFGMVSLLEDVMTILRGNAGKLPFNPEEIDIVDLSAHAVEHVRLTDRGQHQVVFEAGAAALHIQADRRLLQHVVTNLIANAVKYSPVGTRVRVAIHAVEGGVELVVEDEGIGIPEADQPYLFQPFHRARNAAGITGTGLGLSIVKQNVELHGGAISFHSVENQGTTFMVRIPRVAPVSAQSGR